MLVFRHSCLTKEQKEDKYGTTHLNTGVKDCREIVPIHEYMWVCMWALWQV